MKRALMLGLMSGTSLDGITAVLAEFRDHGDGRISAVLVRHHTRPYSRSERDGILSVIDHGSAEAVCRLNFTLGELLAECALDLLALADVNPADIEAIASHGQTIWHIPRVATLQVGEAAVIAERTGCAVVSDFRVRDVAAGGHGAPLVPIADRILFAAPGGWRGLQNLGGIGNISVVPPRGDLADVLAFDTGPGMVLIDGLSRTLTGGEHSMDRDASLSRGGEVIHDVVRSVLSHPFFQERPPRSTGRELFSAGFMEQFVSDCRAARPGGSAADIIATAVELTAASVADACRRFVPVAMEELVISGGGSRHPGVRSALQRLLAPVPVRLFDEIFFSGDAKEGVAFALLGYLHLRGRPGNEPSATGARGVRVLGKLTPP